MDPPSGRGAAPNGTASSAPAGGLAEPAEPDLDLPSVPTSTGPSVPPPGVQDELDELTKRFEALKRR
jgi:hypothetical protein